MFVLLGAHGNITSRAARALLEQRHPVRVIGRNPASLQPLHKLGAQLAIGDARDASFLTEAFAGAQAVYTMIPPDYGAPDMLGAMSTVGSAIADAIARSGVRRVVNLSSVGAELPSGTGPIAGLHAQERRLDALPGLELLHLRPAYFMENHLHAIDVIAEAGIYPSLESPDVPVPMVATADIATVVVRELVRPGARGVLHLHAPQPHTFREVAAIIGTAIGQPTLPYVQVELDAGLAAMQQLGFSPDAANRMAEMARWISQGTHATPRDNAERMPTKLEDFAPRFREAFDARRKRMSVA